MEQYLGDQQFVPLLLYLHDIYMFAPDVGTMSDHIQLVSNQLRSFNLKIKPKVLFFQASIIFLGHIFSADGISANPEKVDKVRDWPVPRMPRNYVHS